MQPSERGVLTDNRRITEDPRVVSPANREMSHPLTLAIDIGGTSAKASVLDIDGEMVVDPVGVATTYPMTPNKLVTLLVDLVKPLPDAERVSAGFPGMVEGGTVLWAPRFSTEHGPGSDVDADLVEAWRDFDLAGALADALGIPARIANDADVQGAAVVTGHGVELTITLGTDFGTSVFRDGRVMPQLKLARKPFRQGETYNEQLGEAARRAIGNERWDRRVHKVIENLRNLVSFDHCYIGGGNSRFLAREDYGDDVTLVDNLAGILGGIRLWENSKIVMTSVEEEVTVWTEEQR